MLVRFSILVIFSAPPLFSPHCSLYCVFHPTAATSHLPSLLNSVYLVPFLTFARNFAIYSKDEYKAHSTLRSCRCLPSQCKHNQPLGLTQLAHDGVYNTHAHTCSITTPSSVTFGLGITYNARLCKFFDLYLGCDEY